MKRLGIFSFYDKHGIVEPYIFYLLESIEKILNRLVIVANGELSEEGEEGLRKYTHEIYIRTNTGFDGGAYKDAILKYLDGTCWSEWDELVMFNSTFYGPLYAWEEVFERMQSEDVSFWGLSSYFSSYRGETDYKNKKFPYHIQGYYLVCRREMIKESGFRDFWRNLSYPMDYMHAVTDFEIGFSRYFMSRGYTCKSYLETIAPEIAVNEDKVLYTSMLYGLIAKYRFPIIKRKSLRPYHIGDFENVIRYVVRETDYDVSLIPDYRAYLSSLKKLETFYNCHDRIFIYGHGEVAKWMTGIFHQRGWEFEKYIVTSKTEEEEIEFSQIKFCDKDGIVIAVNKEKSNEIYETVVKSVKESDIYLLDYSLSSS